MHRVAASALIVACFAGVLGCPAAPDTDPKARVDHDGDGHEDAADGGDDCDDADPAVHPGATELCNGFDDDCDGVVGDSSAPGTDEADEDGDGSRVCAGDCDDSEPAINPAAQETCDGVDDDCDGLTDADDPDVDPSEAVWYRDYDGDGYGDQNTTIVSCTGASGYVQTPGDCDDSSSTVSPGAPEVCDSQDNDCDGFVDDTDPDIVDMATWFGDADGDGFGDAAAVLIACLEPADHVLSDTDCDDGDAAINPDAQEVCDTTDNDCDTLVDDADPSVAPGTASYTDADGDGYGDATAVTWLCAPPAGNVYVLGDCDDALAAANPGAPEIWYDGIDEHCDGGDDYDQDGDGDDHEAHGGGDCNDTDPTIASTQPETWYDGIDEDCDGASDDDQDGDGFDLGDDCDDTVASVNPGEVEDCRTVADDDCSGSTNAVDGVGCEMYYSDVDTDGYGSSAGVCACEPTASYPSATNGDCDDADASRSPDATEVCRNDVDDNCDDSAAPCALSDRALSAAEATFVGEATLDDAGRAVSFAGDVNDDGYDDLLIGAQGSDVGGEQSGSTYLLLGSEGMTSAVLSDAPVLFTGEALSDYAGSAVAGVGDVNADGFDDILVGSGYNSDGGYHAGAAYLVLGASSLASASLSTAALEYSGVAAADEAGYWVAGAGDVNADGYADILVGAPYRSGYTGSAYLVLGSPTPHTQSLGTADAEWTGEPEGWAQAGRAVAGAGDVDADGYDDVLVGSIGAYNGALAYAGAAYLVLGGDTPTSGPLSGADVELLGTDADDEAGWSVAGGGDVNADGYADILIGVPSSSAGGAGHGAAYLFLGGTSLASGLVSTADSAFYGTDVSGAGAAVAAAGDVDADGYGDILLGAPGLSTSARGAGSAYLILGSTAPPPVMDATAVFSASIADTAAGCSVGGAGDVNADGYADMLVGAYGVTTSGYESGAAYLILGTGL